MYDIMHLPGVVELGYTGENGFRTIQIDMRPWLQVLPDGVASIVLIRPGETADDAYIAATTMEDGILTWQPGAGDLGEVEGYGQMEVWLEDTNEKRGKSAKCQTFVQGSLSPTSETPPPAQESWLEQMTSLKTETVTAAQSAEDAREAAESAQAAAEVARDAAQAVAGDFQGLSATASGLAAGTSPTVNVTHDEGGLFNLAFGIPKGDKGDQGDPPTDSQVQTAANNYLSQVITNPNSPPLDRALSSNVAAAPADMVGDLKSATNAQLGSFEDGIYQLLNGGMLTGSINADGTIDPSVNYRAYTPVMQKYSRDIFLEFVSPVIGYLIIIYNSSGALQSRTWYDAPQTIPANTYFKICAAASGSTDAIVLYKSISFRSLFDQFAENDKQFSHAITAFANGEKQLFNGGMITGSINADGSINASIKYRAYTPEMQIFDRDITINFASPAHGYFLLLYNSSGVLQSRVYYQVPMNVPSGQRFKVCADAPAVTAPDILFKSVYFNSIIKVIRDEIDIIEDWEDFKQYALMNGSVLFSGEYINGVLSPNGAIDTSSKYRVTTKDILHNVEKIYVRVNTGWQAWLSTYQQDGTHIERTNKTAGIFSIPAGSYFRVCISQFPEVPGTADIKTDALNVYVIKQDEGNNPIRKWVAIGDSLTEVNQTATKRYIDYVAEDLNLEVVNMGVGGTGYVNGGSGSTTFATRAASADTDADIYTFFGSGNDGASTLNNFPIGNPSDTGTSSICGYINACIDAIYTRNPSAIIGLITPTPWAIWPPYGIENASAEVPRDDPAWMRKYSEAIVAVCKRRGIPCLDLYHCSAVRPWDTTFQGLFYSKDGNNGVHPDENGHKYFIAPHVNAFIRELLNFAN